MFRPGMKVGVVCDQYGRPSREAYQTLPGEVMGVTAQTIVVRIDFHDGAWIITTTDDDTLLFQTFH